MEEAKSSILILSIFEEMVASLVERRKGKMTEEEARQVLKDDVNYFGAMLVHMGIVDGMVSGAIHQQPHRSSGSSHQNCPNVKRTLWKPDSPAKAT